MNTKITGIQAQAKKSFETFKTLRPVGAVSLVPDTENKFDPFCVGVYYGDVRLGYIPGLKQDGKYVGSELQRYIIDNKVTTATVVDYGYIDENEVFNDDHRGHLQSVNIDIDIPEDKKSGRIAGKKYIRVTDFISYFAPYGGGDQLIKWAYKQSDTFEGYQKALSKLAGDGTAMHTAIERFLSTGEESDALPRGWDNFYAKYEIKVIEMEQRFYDNDLDVTGQPDLVALVRKRNTQDQFLPTVLDWKSKKKASLKERLQLSIYSKNKRVDGKPIEQAACVCFGSETKQGYSVSVYNKQKIESTYQALKHLRKCMDACGVWIAEDKYWEGV